MSITKLKELMVLSTVRGHPLHGYALAEALESGLGWTLGLSRPTIYAILRRFVERGWIEGEVVRDSRFPEREVYRVTPEGEAAYPGLLRECAAKVTEGTHPIVIILAHLDDLDEATRRLTLESLLSARRHRLAALEAFPPHGGSAGAALSLLGEQISVEISALTSLLGEQPTTPPAGDSR